MRKNVRRGAVLAGMAAIGTLLAILAFADMNKNLVYYLSPEELLARASQGRNSTVRLGGLVQHDSVRFAPKTLELRFMLGMQATGGTPIPVVATGAPPQMFSEGTGAVVEGSYDGQVFHADRVMVKHSNEYRPPAAGEAPKSLYSTLKPPDE